MKRRKFIQLTGSSAAFIAGTGAFTAYANISNNDDDTLRSQALAAFRRFKKVWNFNDFWKRGNTFDACLVFADAADKRWPGEPAVEKMQKDIVKMLRENLDFFNSFDPGTLWADDFGWWGLMALNGRKHLLKLGEKELAAEYLTLSTDKCWEYKRKTAYDNTDTAKPVPHGCRNGDANGDSKGVKNTVTNVLLFLLSSRIYRVTKAENIPDNEKYLDMAYRQWVWFDSWFKLKQYEYLKNISPVGALVQERPMAFFNGSDYMDEQHPPWEKGWIWTGDQGMLVAALTDMLAVKNDVAGLVAKNYPGTNFNIDEFQKKLIHLISLLGNGVKTALVSNKDGIFREAPFYAGFGPVHGNDYLGGRGIMLRYLGSGEEKLLLGVDIDDNIRKSVNALWMTRDTSNNQFRPEFTSVENDKLYIEQFRKLWGLADDVWKWDIAKMKEQNKFGVCQAIGLDMFGAAIKIT